MNSLHLRVHEVRTKNDKWFVMHYRRDEQDTFQHMLFVLEMVKKRSTANRLLITDVDEGTNIVLIKARLASLAPTKGSFSSRYSSCKLVWRAESSFSPEFPNMWLDESPLT